MEELPYISIVIVENYYPSEKLLNCMRSFTNQTYPNYEILLNFWGKEKFNDISKLLKDNDINLDKVKISAYSGAPGFSKNYNMGVEKAKYEYILISNPDVECAPDFLSRIVKSFQNLARLKKTDKLIVGPRIYNKYGNIEYSRRNINFLGYSNIDISKTTNTCRTMVMSGCVFYMKKKYYEELNGFDEYYYMWHEDIDFSIRAELLGIKQYIINSIQFYHLKSDKEFRLNKFKYFYHERNRLLMCFQYSTKKRKMAISQLLFEPLHLLFALKEGFIKERLRIYKYYIQNFFKIIKNKEKENTYFAQYYRMDGVFNEVNSNPLILGILNLLAKMVFYFYHH